MGMAEMLEEAGVDLEAEVSWQMAQMATLIVLKCSTAVVKVGQTDCWAVLTPIHLTIMVARVVLGVEELVHGPLEEEEDILEERENILLETVLKDPPVVVVVPTTPVRTKLILAG